MPEFGPSKDFESFRKVKQDVEFRKENPLAEEELIKAGNEVLGHGGEHVVVAHGEKKVAAIEHSISSENAEMRKATFYCQKILHVLMPSHFPNFHAVFQLPLGKKHMGQGSIRERKEPGTDTGIDFEEEGFLREPELELYEKLKGFEKYGINIYGSLDHWGYNFQRTKDVVVHMDKLEKPFLSTPSDIKNLEQYMLDNKYSESNIKKVRQFGDRVVALLQ